MEYKGWGIDIEYDGPKVFGGWRPWAFSYWNFTGLKAIHILGLGLLIYHPFKRKDKR